MTEPLTNLIKAVGAVMAEVGTLKKDGHNDFSNYDFTTEAMVVGTLRPLLVKHGLIFVPHNVSVTHSEQINEKMRRVIISSTFLLAHVSGESLTITLPGEGMDSLDKSTNKALTAALKYGLLQTFCVGRGDDGDEGGGYDLKKDLEGTVRPIYRSSENAAVRAAASAGTPGSPSLAHDFEIKIGKNNGKMLSEVDTGWINWYVGALDKDLKDDSKKNFHPRTKKQLDSCLTELNRRAQNAVGMASEPEQDLPF